jgi:hypothetical protein
LARPNPTVSIRILRQVLLVKFSIGRQTIILKPNASNTQALNKNFAITQPRRRHRLEEVTCASLDSVLSTAFQENPRSFESLDCRRAWESDMAVAGDVFAVRLPGGRFGAIRIIKLMHSYVSSKATYHVVYCSTYLDSKPPTIDDPRLREPLRQHRFANGKRFYDEVRRNNLSLFSEPSSTLQT